MQVFVDSSRWKPVKHAHWYLVTVVSDGSETHSSFGPQSVPLMLHSGPSEMGVTKEGVMDAGMPVGETVFSSDDARVCVNVDDDEFDKDSRGRIDAIAELTNS